MFRFDITEGLLGEDLDDALDHLPSLDTIADMHTLARSGYALAILDLCEFFIDEDGDEAEPTKAAVLDARRSLAEYVTGS